MKAESSFEAMLPIVMRAVDSVLRRRGKRKDFADDFRGWVVLKMLEREAAILKQFRGESTLFTYLHVIVARLYCDYLISQNGKWRSSKRARQLGVHAVFLEKLVYRDGYSLGEAVAVLQSREGKWSDSELRDGFSEIPCRPPRRSVPSEKLLKRIPDTRPSVCDVLLQKEIDQKRRAVLRPLSDSLAELAEEDLLILKLHFCRGLRISEISRLLELKQRSVYNRVYRLLRALRKKLESRSVSVDASAVGEMTETNTIRVGIEGAFAEAAVRLAAVTDGSFAIKYGFSAPETEGAFELADVRLLQSENIANSSV